MQSLLDLHGRSLVGLALLRAVPVISYVIASRRFNPKVRSLTLIGTAALVALDSYVDPLATEVVLYGTLTYGYFLCATWISIGVLRQLPGLGRLKASCVLAALFVCVPATMQLRGLSSFAVVIGFEMLLSSYSIYMSCYRAGRTPECSEHLFFVLVNPVVVFAQRGRVSSVWRPSALWRALVGLFVIFAGRVVVAAAEALARQGAGITLTPEATLVFYAGLVGTYWKHSGLASVQIGLMRFAGCAIPERYQFPLAATSPLDFWRRWNTYVGSWARRYLFTPIALTISRHGTLRGPAMVGASVAATFIAIGLLHDAAAFADGQQVSGRWVLFFAVQAIAVVLTEGARRTRWHQSLPSAMQQTIGWVTASAAVILTIALTLF